MINLDTLAAVAGATHKDAQCRGRYYRLNQWIGHCQMANINDGILVWRYFGSELPATAIALKDDEPLGDDEFQS